MNAVEQALAAKLAGDATLIGLLGGTAIWNGVVPRDRDLPAVVFSLASGIEEHMTPRRSVNMVYLVKGIAPTMYQAGQIADRVDAVLNGATLAVSGWGTAFWCGRESVIRYLEQDPAGWSVAHAGGEYRIRIAQ